MSSCNAKIGSSSSSFGDSGSSSDASFFFSGSKNPSIFWRLLSLFQLVVARRFRLRSLASTASGTIASSGILAMLLSASSQSQIGSGKIRLSCSKAQSNSAWQYGEITEVVLTTNTKLSAVVMPSLISSHHIEPGGKPISASFCLSNQGVLSRSITASASFSTNSRLRRE